MRWYWRLRAAWERDPPTDWFTQAEHQYVPPEEKKKPPGQNRSKFDWSKWEEARANTLAMGNLMSTGNYIKPN